MKLTNIFVHTPSYWELYPTGASFDSNEGRKGSKGVGGSGRGGRGLVILAFRGGASVQASPAQPDVFPFSLEAASRQREWVSSAAAAAAGAGAGTGAVAAAAAAASRFPWCLALAVYLGGRKVNILNNGVKTPGGSWRAGT